MAAKDRQQILVTGNPKENGFTLLELMVVVALIGLLSATIIVNFSPDVKEKPLPETIARMKFQLRTISERAIVEQRWFGFSFSDHAYQLMSFTKQGWEKESSSTQQIILQKIDILLESEGAVVRFDDTKQEPQIQVSPDGFITPFRLRLSLLNEEQELTDPYAPN